MTSHPVQNDSSFSIHTQVTEINCQQFIDDFQNAVYERGQAQLFCAKFLELFGISTHDIISGEALEHRIRHFNPDTHRLEQCFIDAFIRNKIIIEMKSTNVKLDQAEDQIRKYYDDLPKDERPRLRMICDFKTIILRDMVADIRYEPFLVKDLFNHAYKFNCLLDLDTPIFNRDQERLSMIASEKMASVYNAFKSVGFSGHDLMVMLVRLLFCMYAEDTDVFPQLSFTTLIGDTKEDGSDLKHILSDLFNVLNKPESERRMITSSLEKFPYVNGGLFGSNIELPSFENQYFQNQLVTNPDTGRPTNPVRQAIYDCCWFDWHDISPAIFGAMFQDVMSSNERRQGGVHYTSLENILKVIRPLFLDQLNSEWETIEKTHNLKKYKDFQNKLAGLKFLDPACGCGNFLMVAYQELRRIENKVIKAIVDTDRQLYLNNADIVCRVSISQFYGIEILEFPCEVARVSMWLMKHMMDTELQKAISNLIVSPFLPLQGHANITHGNALSIDWESLLDDSSGHYDYIFGNPPFVGSRVQGENGVEGHSQKEDIHNVFNGMRGGGDLDYASCWFKKSADIMVNHPKTHTALVATNSLTQGIHPYLLWKPICESGCQIEFAYKTFRWDNDAADEAKVHCVIIGFNANNQTKHTLFETDGTVKECEHINAYLMDWVDVFVKRRSQPLCESPHMCFGNMPRDGGGFILNEQEREKFICQEPITTKWIYPYIGANEYIKGRRRYCLWLQDVDPDEIQKSNLVKERLLKVKEARLASTAIETRLLANTPTLFAQITQPIDKDFIIIPRTSSESRGYIPIGFLPSGVIASDATLVIPEATLYHFGILTSSVHMAWMRTICGRLEMRYRYSKEIVYNNFIWPTISEKQKVKIEKTAQLIIDVRNHHDSTMKSLYGITMPPDLFQAHMANDRAVMEAYGFNHNMTEAEIVAELFKMYKDLTDEEDAR